MKEDKNVKGKLLLMLPILALPFLTFAFWAFGGGHLPGENSEKSIGINAELPDAKPEDDSALDKMAFYDQAEKAAGKSGADSIRDTQNGMNDNFGTPYGDNQSNTSDYTGFQVGAMGSDHEGSKVSEARIRQRMQELQSQLETGAESDYPGKEFNHTNRLSTTEIADSPPTVMAPLIPPADTTDAEMDQLQVMMNRIYDIQHPEEVANRLKATSEQNRGILYPVTTTKPENTIHFLSPGSIDHRDSGNIMATATAQFYGLPTHQSIEPITGKGIGAVTQQDQMLVNGASIKLRLQQDVFVNGLLVPKGTPITGQVQLSNDRLQIEVVSLLSGQYLLPVKLEAYDTDGMEGLNVPGSINQDVIRQSGDNTLQGIRVGTLNPSLSAQAAAAGIETAKTLFTRKLKLTKVFVKAGHQLLLKNQ